MGREKIILDKNQLKSLYLDKNLSPYKIADLFGCSFSTVTNRLKEYKIPLKNNSVARQKYVKKNFSGSSAEKCYMVGFRVGDLNAYQTNPDSEVIVVRCHTTTKDQLDVIQKLFAKYGKVTISQHADKSYHINCFLNKSFIFLLRKDRFSENIQNEDDFFAFFAGYLDAEGYIGINQGKARLKIDSYDEEVLKYLIKGFEKYRIDYKFRIISICKDRRNFGKELYRLNINSAQALEKLFIQIDKLCLHQKRINQIKAAKENIENRKNGN